MLTWLGSGLVGLGVAVAYRRRRRSRLRRALSGLAPGQRVGVLQELAGDPLADTRRIAAPLMREMLQQSVADPAHMPEALVARYLAPYVGEDGLNHLLALARAVDRDDMQEVELERMDVPSLIVWGDQDRFVSPKLGDRLADLIPGSRLVRLPSVARLVPEEAPDALANIILEFVGAAGMVRAGND